MRQVIFTMAVLMATAACTAPENNEADAGSDEDTGSPYSPPDKDTGAAPESDVDSDSDSDSDLPASSDKDSDEFCPEFKSGDVFAVPTRPENINYYYILDDSSQVRYFAPYADTIFTWRPRDTHFPVIRQECLDRMTYPDKYPMGINPRPGSYIVKREASDALYAVLPGNTLARITPEAAKVLYGTPAMANGADDAPQVCPDAYWPNFINRADDITSPKVHPGMIFTVADDEVVYYAESDSTIRELTADGFTSNSFQERFIREVNIEAVDGMAIGEPIATLIPEITDPVQR